ncbi:RNA-binding S4 domain-containing protein [Paludibacterium yongneupense]|uniref:RNA-binding S4 domain-containing protein n=1 Tax=Paludibacterium yongneupense TaxID=400061 RepID=UPI000409CC78|nr:S4 domain-containing protein [Paludibacterium yongneupense]
MAQANEQDDDRVRLDKWLWAARFFKTRQLAHEALDLGRVLVNGERAKSSRLARVGDALLLRINQLEYHIEVRVLSGQRRPAVEARTLYSEGAESVAAREAKQALLSAGRASFPHGDGRPTKKARREIQRLKSTY